MIMKKTNFFYAAAIALVSTFGMTSCSVEDNPNPDPIQYVVEQVSLQDIPFYDCEGTLAKMLKRRRPQASHGLLTNQQVSLMVTEALIIFPIFLSTAS